MPLAPLAQVKEVYLAHLLAKLPELKVRSAIIFCSTCKGCHLLSLVLERLGVAAAALHSHKPQRQRLAALDRFKSGAVPILLATGEPCARMGGDLAASPAWGGEPHGWGAGGCAEASVGARVGGWRRGRRRRARPQRVCERGA